MSGTTGNDFVYATSPSGSSQLFTINTHHSAAATPFGAPVNNVPSRWAHRRRTLGGLETALISPVRGLFVTPMGSGVGTGAIHVLDRRPGGHSSLVPTGNPAGYDLAVCPSLKFLFSAEDDGAGHTILRGFAYAVPGSFTALSPASLTLSGSPAAYVNRMGVDNADHELHLPTSTGIHVILLSGTGTNMTSGPFFSTGAEVATTNPISFERNGQTTWIVGTASFSSTNPPVPFDAGYFSWTSSGALGSGTFGAVPSAPSKNWVPAAGAEELAVVSNGTSSYAYSLLREPPPGTFFIKPSAIGVVRFIGASPPTIGTIAMTSEVGEPFSIPTVSGYRVAFESSFGPPFNSVPPGGGEVVSILYSPLDSLGAASVNGVLGVPRPLGGRISTKGMDRPIWSRDGTRVMAATSHFPGAPNPGVPGLEVLEVPPNIVVDSSVGPHTVVADNPFPNQSILFPTIYVPNTPTVATLLGGISFYGNVFNGGVASMAASTYGEIGQLQPEDFVQSPAVPDFPSILPPAFDDVGGSIVPIPLNFGARRTTFNLAPSGGLAGLTMSAAIDDEILVQVTGFNLLSILNLTPPSGTIHVALPAGYVTTTEFLSL